MTVDTTELRARSKIIDPGLPLTAKAMVAAADELDALRRALAAVPHAELCRLLMTRDGEPCSCEKSAIATASTPASPLVSDETSVTYLGVTRLNVFGPGGLVNGVLGVTGVHVDLVENGRALQVVFEQGETTT